jgi:hypothetical protein
MREGPWTTVYWTYGGTKSYFGMYWGEVRWRTQTPAHPTDPDGFHDNLFSFCCTTAWCPQRANSITQGAAKV